MSGEGCMEGWREMETDNRATLLLLCNGSKLMRESMTQ